MIVYKDPDAPACKLFMELEVWIDLIDNEVTMWDQGLEPLPKFEFPIIKFEEAEMIDMLRRPQFDYYIPKGVHPEHVHPHKNKFTKASTHTRKVIQRTRSSL